MAISHISVIEIEYELRWSESNFAFILEPPAGIEPTTYALRERRSTD